MAHIRQSSGLDCLVCATSNVILSANVVEALGLAAPDQTGTSDPFVKVFFRALTVLYVPLTVLSVPDSES